MGSERVQSLFPCLKYNMIVSRSWLCQWISIGFLLDKKMKRKKAPTKTLQETSIFLKTEIHHHQHHCCSRMPSNKPSNNEGWHCFTNYFVLPATMVQDSKVQQISGTCGAISPFWFWIKTKKILFFIFLQYGTWTEVFPGNLIHLLFCNIQNLPHFNMYQMQENKHIEYVNFDLIYKIKPPINSKSNNTGI